jgi:hypothetical protein
VFFEGLTKLSKGKIVRDIQDLNLGGILLAAISVSSILPE